LILNFALSTVVLCCSQWPTASISKLHDPSVLRKPRNWSGGDFGGFAIE